MQKNDCGKFSTLFSITKDHLHTRCLRIASYFAFTKSDRRAMGVLSVLIAATILLRAWGIAKPAKEWVLSKNEITALQNGSTRKKADSAPDSNRLYKQNTAFSQNPAAQKNTPGRYTPPAYMVKKKFTVDLNRADTFDLQEIRGIGPVYARRIVAYREKLGGFVRIDQLREVWGIDSLLFRRMEASVYLQNPVPRKIRLNQADIRELKQHPYLDYYQAKEIYLHRKKYGPFTSIDKLRKVNLMDSGTYARLQPYLSTALPETDTGKGKP